MSLRPYRPGRNDWNPAAVQHLFRRASFGATPARCVAALANGLEPTLDELFEDDAPEPALHEGIRPLLAQDDIEPLQAWWLALLLSGRGGWRERLALVWHNHFATSHDKVADVRLMHRQNELFRSQGAGDFRALLHAVARDTAMLRWLDGDRNRIGHPNENFAREVMELFGLGIGHYTEEDVREAARALTGWGTKGRSSVFREQDHDPGVKAFLGRKGSLGAKDVIDAVLAQPACSRHIARRLLIEYVAPEPETDWIEALATELRDNEWHVADTLRTLFGSELFFSAAARRTRIASPVELLVSSAHSLEVRIAPKRAARLSAAMGQALFRPPNVKGWDGNEAWINVGTWIARHNALLEVVSELEAPGDGPEETVGALRENLLPGVEAEPLDAALRAAIRDARDETQRTRIAAALILTSPEYQLT